MQSDEKQWRELEQVLRRLVGRLCAAGMGVDPQLDAELAGLAAANRRNADAAELEALTASLTAAVEAVDAVSPVPTIVIAAPAAKRWDSTCASTVKVLQCLASLGAGEGVQDLIARLAKAGSDAELAAILEKTAELIHAFGDALAGERLQAAAVLSNVTTGFTEMLGYLTVLGEASRSQFSDSAAINVQVMQEVREMTAQVSDATELPALQSLVIGHLQTLTEQVVSFREREEKRQLEQANRTEHMRARVEILEHESRDLHSKLDREKFGARHDPLTLVANRKSFDERLSEVMLQRSRDALPVAMLLWDLDNFKTINDTFGHRAGDRVLKSVAACLMSGVRPDDFVARIGGEEFVVLLCGLPFSKALQIADELRWGVAALRFHFRGSPVLVTASCGLTELRAEDSGAMVFDRADAALYKAKSGGRNLCVAA